VVGVGGDRLLCYPVLNIFLMSLLNSENLNGFLTTKSTSHYVSQRIVSEVTF